MRFRLIPLEGGPSIEVIKDLSVVGRRQECDIFLEHKSISKLHCVIAKTDGLLLVRDLGSTNGTRVNGQRVRRAALIPDDELHVALVKFKIAVGPESPSPGPAPAEDFTQRVDGKELAKLKLDENRDEDSDVGADMPLVQANVLPDRYTERPLDKKT